MTPFEKAGYKKDTKFRSLENCGDITTGDILTLGEDDGTDCLKFVNNAGKSGYFFLPNTNMGELEAIEEIDIKEQKKTK